MSTSHLLKKLQYDNKDVVAEVANRDGNGNIITETYALLSDIPTTTSELTNDSGFITLSDVPQELYWCTYGTTTYAEITAAITAGKLPVCKYNSHIYVYTIDENSVGHIFALVKAGGTSNGSIIRLVCDTNNSWARYSVTLEAQNNRVTSISSLSTNAQYPTAKCVYDAIQNTSIYPVGNTNYRIQFKVVNGQPQLEYEEVA